jgi:hypothetical protein
MHPALPVMLILISIISRSSRKAIGQINGDGDVEKIRQLGRYRAEERLTDQLIIYKKSTIANHAGTVSG